MITEKTVKELEANDKRMDSLLDQMLLVADTARDLTMDIKKGAEEDGDILRDHVQGNVDEQNKQDVEDLNGVEDEN